MDTKDRTERSQTMSLITYFDFETDDNKPESCNGIQFAAAAFKSPPVGETLSLNHHNMILQDEIELKIEFDVEKANPESLEVNHFDQEVWEAEAMSEREAVTQIYRFLNRYKTVKQISKRGRPYYVARIAGHNAAGFDFTVLLRMFRKYDEFLPVSFDVLDTWRLASWLKYCDMLPGEPKNLKLSTLCELFGIPIDAHDALGDVRANAELGFQMTELLKTGKKNGSV